MKIVFATNNKHKLEEIRRMLAGKHEIVSLADIGCHDEIPEEQDTLEGNAFQKARYIKEHYGYDCFADDTGLEIEALGGRPGVYSARYAGEDKDSEANMQKVLAEMQGCDNRRARFRTAIALVFRGEEHLFEGEVRGEILRDGRKVVRNRRLEKGVGLEFAPDGQRPVVGKIRRHVFGRHFDPIFVPAGLQRGKIRGL